MVPVGASTVAVFALLGLTTFSVVQAHWAEQAEHQAQQRRQQADDLLSFMLGEFADKLRPIGRLELLDSVGTKALSYLSANDGLSPQERLQRAKALTVLGEVRVSKRDMEGAREPLVAAQALLEGPPPSKEMAGAWYKAQGAAAFWEGHSYFTKRISSFRFYRKMEHTICYNLGSKRYFSIGSQIKRRNIWGLWSTCRKLGNLGE